MVVLMRRIVVFTMLLVLLSGTVAAVHDNGGSSSGYWVDVATDGFDNGYYLIVWSNGSGAFGALYQIRDNTLVDNVTVDNLDKAFQIGIASKLSGVIGGHLEDNKYLIVWKRNSTKHLYGRLYDYQGNPLTDVFQIYGENPVGDYVGVSYGGGYFVVLFGRAYASARNELYYAVIDENGNIVDSGLLFDGKDRYTNGGAIKYLSLGYNPDLGVFGAVFRVADDSGNYEVGFLKFKLLSNGHVDTSSIGYTTIDPPTSKDAYHTSMAYTNGGFLAAYSRSGGTSERLVWYTRPVYIADDGSVSLGSTTQLFTNYNAGHGDLTFVENGTNDYLVFVWELRDNPDDNNDPFYLNIQRLKPDGTPLGSAETLIKESNSKRNPAIVAKPAHSPETYIVVWIDDTADKVQNSEYFYDLSEVSTTNEVPFFGNMAVAALILLGGLWLFRRR
ncbi:hypothetical protein E3E38_04735 [Thermococcus sp. 18S1]|uniref:hypothetical protein n=1 Tax=Thermococcus sp. 18S1 TaxID=1638210 RepID=UPI00143BB874|nr:hypothetical protein [Thermococcus sp. 18S1]NJE30357.1 hypothetical protein [Thermococcus sp. 18S1]